MNDFGDFRWFGITRGRILETLISLNFFTILNDLLRHRKIYSSR